MLKCLGFHVNRSLWLGALENVMPFCWGLWPILLDKILVWNIVTWRFKGLSIKYFLHKYCVLRYLILLTVAAVAFTCVAIWAKLVVWLSKFFYCTTSVWLWIMKFGIYAFMKVVDIKVRLTKFTWTLDSDAFLLNILSRSRSLKYLVSV